MTDLAILVHYDYCSGCQSCLVSCKKEKQFDSEPYGVTLLQNGPYDLGDDNWEWDNIPSFTDRCDMCVERIDKGEKPPCVIHCLANCIEIGPFEDLVNSMSQKEKKVFIVRP